MAWNRQIELSVGQAGLWFLISDLDIEFDITRSITAADNTAEFVVYNAKPNTRKKILKKGNNIIFKAGYEDEGIGTLFIGNITAAHSIKEDVSWKTFITASSISSSKKSLENTTFSISYNSNSFLSPIISEIAVSMNLVVLGLENITNVTLPNGCVYVGNAKGVLDYCNKILKKIDKALYIDNNEIIVYNVGEQNSRFSGVLLDYESGLKSVEEITENVEEKKEKEKRISFNSILIPKIQPNGLIDIRNTTNNGAYLVEKVNYTGDNMGGAFDCTGEAIA